MAVEVAQREFHASVYWAGNGFQAVWSVRIGPQEELSDGLMSLMEGGARHHVKWEAGQLGFDVIHWEDGSTEPVNL